MSCMCFIFGAPNPQSSGDSDFFPLLCCRLAAVRLRAVALSCVRFCCAFASLLLLCSSRDAFVVASPSCFCSRCSFASLTRPLLCCVPASLRCASAVLCVVRPPSSALCVRRPPLLCVCLSPPYLPVERSRSLCRASTAPLPCARRRPDDCLRKSFRRIYSGTIH